MRSSSCTRAASSRVGRRRRFLRTNVLWRRIWVSNTRAERGETAVLLEAEHLDASYGPVQVLWDVSLEVDETEVVALVGSNGAGKTTLLRALSGLISVSGGDVRFAGRSIAGL